MKHQRSWFTLLVGLLAFGWRPSDAYRVLGLFPHPGLSHFKVFHPIMRGLAEAGHHVTVVSYFPDNEPLPNYQDFRFEGQDILTNAFSLQDFTGRTLWDNFKEFFELSAWGAHSCKAALSSAAIDEVLRIHRATPYDLVVMEMFATDCLAGMAWLMRVPFVGLSSCALMPWHYDRVGLPDTPAYIPSEFSSFSEAMSLAERAENWLVTKLTKLAYSIIVESNDNRALNEKFPHTAIPDVRQIVRNVSLILVNQHYTLSGARPLVPVVVEVGGVHIGSPRPLPKALQAFLDNSPDGVIVVSFGSVLKAATLPDRKRQAMLEAFKGTNMKVLWKWETEMDDRPGNVFTQKWLPQRDVLAHRNVRLFVSHGGLLGVSEAVHCGVPIVAMPIYGDQFLNTAALVNRGLGVRMEYARIDDNSYVKRCIDEGLNGEKLVRARAVSKAYRHRPQTPLALALWSLENVIAHGGMQLERSYGADLPWFVYHSLDVMGIFVTTLLAIIVPSVWWFCKTCKTQQIS
ncbi:UDP-glucosyltransferase 2-like [Anopheles bellator]|uniref:UDP-glucosyltransferase 2-like n=1 Tax=Anopheles bellator TaxID=139047 RepID=UPI0026486A87|nr:UDP-glucosyltransferase 2-like [Anopheles bellator]